MGYIPNCCRICWGGGKKPIIIETNESNDFKITPDQLKKAITKNTKILVLVSPSNPTESLYSKEELKEIAKVLENTNILVLSDEIYEDLIFSNKKHISPANINEDMYNRTIIVNGLSKSVSMTGWRFGYLACNDNELVKKLISLQSQSTSNISSISQKAAIPFFMGEVDKEVQYMKNEFKNRRDMALELFKEIKGLSVSNPEGAFYLFINIQEIENNSILFCKKLLEEEKVAVVPGIAFGLEGYFRFSYAVDIKTINEGIKRIKKFCENYN